MSTMVKRVAQALQQEMAGTAPFDEAASLALAHAAIAAMREPTEEMIDAWIGAPGAIKGGWQAMIDCALRETDDEPVAEG
jgi:L-cysteine desulfidase